MQTDDRTVGERVSDLVAAFGGSWKFIFLGFGIIIVWMFWNLYTPLIYDPYPFILLNLLLSCVAAFQAPFIMMSQNRSELKQDEAHRRLLGEIKTLIQQDIRIEKKILKLLENKD
jgi:uncharacterized membrane protein